MATYPDDWLDMSDFVAHFTMAGPANRRPYDNIMSILGGRKLKALTPFGAARTMPRQEAICFSEVPLGLLGRLAQRRSRFGIAFTKQFLTDNGGSPIWYLEKDGPQHEALERLLVNAKQTGEGHPLFEITPFIDVKGDYPTGSYRWEWEREWRVVGDLSFGEDDVAFLFLPEEDHGAAWSFFAEIVFEQHLGPSYTCPFLDPTWDSTRIRSELEDHKERFRALADRRRSRFFSLP